MAIEEKKFLGTAGVQQLITNTRTEIEAAKKAANDYADSLADNYDAAGTAATKVNELANGQVKTNTEHIGTMANLETTAKADLVTAINEVRNAVSAGGTAAAMTMTEQTTGLGDGIAKAYVLKQGENTVGTINIPKDMVVQSGEVVVDPEGQTAGTYIKLTLANATNDVIYVNVGTLVDVYKAKAKAAQVQIAIDSATRVISATIVAGSVTATELADNAVTTAKIANFNVTTTKLADGAVVGNKITDGTVTKAKLASAVQASLDKADAAAQDATDKAAQALADAKELATGLNTAMNTRVAAMETIKHTHSNEAELNKINTGDVAKWNNAQSAAEATAKSYTDSAANALNNRVGILESAKHTHANKAKLDTYDKTQTELLAAANAYADSKVEGVDLSGIATNAEDIDKLEASLATGGATANAIADAKKAGTDASAHADELNTAMNTRVEALENVSYVEISAADINSMFAS